ncbi:MAG: acyl-CoA thioesterase [Paracoccaceae bacterium]
MFPFIRLFKEIALYRKAPRLGLHETHFSNHICWPWDLDMAAELNNGRTLSLLDLGRVPLMIRLGMLEAMREHRWGAAMAGVVVRYRQRIKNMQRFEMRSRLVGWDQRFLYMEQSMWKAGEICANHAVYRVAVTDRNGIVPAPRVAEAIGLGPDSPPLDEWIELWSRAEDARPWPPQMTR